MMKQLFPWRPAGWQVFVLAAACTPTVRPPGVVAPTTPATSTVFCANYRTGRNGPVCTRQMTSEEVKNHHLSWKLTIDKRRVIHSSRQNSRGFSEHDDDGQVSHEYTYDVSGLREIRSFDELGHVVMRMIYSNQGKNVDYLDEWGRKVSEGDTWHTSEVRSYDTHGFVRDRSWTTPWLVRMVPPPNSRRCFVCSAT